MKKRAGVLLVMGLFWAMQAQAKTASEVFEAVSPSVVVIKTYDVKGKDTGLGSGVALADGLIVTNCHVIKSATSMKVEYQKKEYPASPRQTDWDRDVCTLSVNGLHAPSAVLGTTNRLKVGQQVYAVGTPQGLALTLSNGIVSSLRPVDGGQYLQITAPISPGSSGGGLFDDEGRLIGLPTFYLTEGQQLNFAVPVEWIKELPKRHRVASNSKKTAQGISAPKASPPTTTDWLNKAFALFGNRDWLGLQDHVLRWVKAEPGNDTARLYLGLAYEQSNQPAKAIDAYMQAVRINQKFAEAWNNLGSVYMVSSQPAKAIDAYMQAVRANPNLAASWSNMGIPYADLGQFTKAIEAYRQAVRINPEDVDAWYNMGVVYGEIGQTTNAIEAYQQAVRIDTEYSSAWYNMARAYGKSDQVAKEIEAYQQTVRINPEKADAWFNLGVAYRRLNQTDKAIEAYQQAVRINPDDVGAWYNMGFAYGKSDQPSQAIEAYQQAVRIKPEYVDAWVMLGVVYKVYGQPIQVEEVYNRLRVIDSTAADDFFSKIVMK